MQDFIQLFGFDAIHTQWSLKELLREDRTILRQNIICIQIETRTVCGLGLNQESHCMAIISDKRCELELNDKNQQIKPNGQR